MHQRITILQGFTWDELFNGARYMGVDTVANLRAMSLTQLATAIANHEQNHPNDPTFEQALIWGQQQALQQQAQQPAQTAHAQTLPQTNTPWIPIALIAAVVIVGLAIIYALLSRDDKDAEIAATATASEERVAQLEATIAAGNDSSNVTQEDLASALAALQSGAPAISEGSQASASASSDSSSDTGRSSWLTELEKSTTLPNFDVVPESGPGIIGADGQEAEASGACKSCAEDFVVGDSVLGWSIHTKDGGIVCDGGKCFIESAWFDGYAIDGVVHPTKEDLNEQSPLRLITPPADAATNEPAS